jgi:hypothetical protein
MTMIKRNKTWKDAGPFAAGVLIGMSVVTPVFAATLDVESLQPWLLLGSLVLLLIALIMKAMATPRPAADAEPATVNAGDLRWRETDPAADVALPGLMRSGTAH